MGLSLLMLISLHAQCVSPFELLVSWVSGHDLPVPELPFTLLELIQHSC